jgi:hypothetical protein
MYTVHGDLLLQGGLDHAAVKLKEISAGPVKERRFKGVRPSKGAAGVKRDSIETKEV